VLGLVNDALRVLAAVADLDDSGLAAEQAEAVALLALVGQRLASNLPETMPCNAMRSTMRPRFGRAIELD
jgi:1,6-anhydro-N-acetylmuramate kinase